VYIYGGSYNGTNVIYLDGSTGNAYFAGTLAVTGAATFSTSAKVVSGAIDTTVASDGIYSHGTALYLSSPSTYATYIYSGGVLALTLASNQAATFASSLAINGAFTGATTGAFSGVITSTLTSGNIINNVSAGTGAIRLAHIGTSGTDAYIGVASSAGGSLVTSSPAYSMEFRNDTGFAWGLGSTLALLLNSSGISFTNNLIAGTNGAFLQFQSVTTDTSAAGITWYTSGAGGYGIWKTAGTWSSPNYQQLNIGFNTGIIIDGGTLYGKSGTSMQPSGGPVTMGGTLGVTGAITQNGNQVLHAGNYTSYSPGLTGSGASGTWGISITGNAATVTGLVSQDGSRYTTNFNSILATGFYNAEATPTNSPGGSYGQLIVARGIDTGFQIYGGYGNDEMWFRGWATYGSTWYNWRRVLHNNNFNSYAPTLTGTGASGTWGISVTGSAGSVAASGVTAGTFGAGAYTFPGALAITGAFTGATTGAFSSTVQITGNATKINWYSAGYENWYAGTATSSTAFVIGSATTASILTLGTAGAATFSSTATATDFILSSDTRLKTNITPITSALTKVNTITGYTFEFIKDSGKRRSGVLAQEIQDILPEAVYTDADGYLSVSYDAIIPLLIQAIKELRDEVKK
jgi:hypothetical protein